MTDTLPAKRTHYLPVNVLGDIAVVGDVLDFEHVADVTDVAAEHRGDRIIVTWTWPEECRSAIVSWRTDAPPASPQDQAARHQVIGRGEYLANGGAHIPATGRGVTHVRIFARSEDGLSYAAAAGPEANCQAGSRKIAIRYSVRRTPFSRSVVIQFESEETIEDVPAILIVAAKGTLQPQSPMDGDVIVRREPRGIFAGEPATLPAFDVPAGPVYLMAFLEHPDERIFLREPPLAQLKFR